MTNEAVIQYCGEPARVACDRMCSKAWGISNRPRIELSADPDDYAFLADHEVGTAPVNPGTYECDSAKPTTPDAFPTKWCVRECERCAMSSPGAWAEPLRLRSFAVRLFNQPWKHAPAAALDREQPHDPRTRS